MTAHIAMPLGGIGTGNLAIGADGGLRQWQLQNVGNHKGDLPGTFFALRVSQIEPPLNQLVVLQSPAAQPTGTPLVNDDYVPAWQHRLVTDFRPVDTTTFRGRYPFAEIGYRSGALPVTVDLEAFNPLIPLDAERSSLPVAMFTFTIANVSDLPAHVWLGAAMQNPVGHDGTTFIDGVSAIGYGGNFNRVRRTPAWSSLVFDNATVDPLSPGAGQAVLSVDSPGAAVLPQWADPHEFMSFLDALPVWGDPQPTVHCGPSAPGRTWNGGLVVAHPVQPGASVRVKALIAWHFPNRYVNFAQFGPPEPRWGKTRFWLGNAYTQRFADAVAVAECVAAQWDSLREDSLRWRDTLGDREHLAAQAAILRSPSCFRTADGAFFGFEGVLGASTAMWSGHSGGSCPLNCTHVWNYVQAVAKLFPELERSMRDTEFRVMQAPAGYIPHRVIVPAYLPQLWDKPIGGPEEPALDGMLGSILKSYREIRHGAPLEAYWPDVKRLLAHIRGKWDPGDSGVLTGIQPSTHDIDLKGSNTFTGTLWLAALRACEEMARLAEDPGFAASLRTLFERGSQAYDSLLFNGSYYIQVLEDGESPEFQWLEGCLADQLIGQWWAHQLDLGYVLPREHVVSALKAVVRHNLRQGFGGFEHPYRVFADGDDTGLLMCTWPLGGRPEVPTRYCDEVWTGSEYQVAAHCLWEGLAEEAAIILDGVWSRYDGSRRNPYNEIECGDHYVRAMAGWSVLDAMSGIRWHDPSRTLSVRPGAYGRWPLLLPSGWGVLHHTADGLDIICHHGEMSIASVAQRTNEPFTLTAGQSRRLPAVKE